MTLSAKKNWVKKRCVPCEGGVPVIAKKEALRTLKEMKGWQLSKDAGSITAEWVMKDFLAAVQLVNRIARLAEKEDHHPDIHLTDYRKLKIELNTHAIGGLSVNDFILAAKINKLPKSLKV